MARLVHELPLHAARLNPDAPALTARAETLTYAELGTAICRLAAGLMQHGLRRLDRVAIYLPKTPEAVIAMFGASCAGGVFVPINPLLKAAQVRHILIDSGARILVTSADRLEQIADELAACADLHDIIVVGRGERSPQPASRINVAPWTQVIDHGERAGHRVIDADMAALLYTSGSTGKPKGVVLSHRNMVTGAESVSEYLGNTPDDRLLAVLPFSFDYGFSQLSTAFNVAASVVLMDYLFPRDIVAMVDKERITGLAGVPPLWAQLADLDWPATVTRHLRYITNSGGTMPVATLTKLRRAFPETRVFLMYGLTEAFRSTYLDPAQVEQRPESIGKAIPNAEILVVRPDGTRCAPDEPGELVHRGSLVALGYWNDPQKTAERFKPVPGQESSLVLTEMAVWSGDTVKVDAEGYLYFIGRRDEMIKTSGFRVSPTEVEEAVYASGLVADAVAVGVPHPVLGQAIVVVASPAQGQSGDGAQLLEECRRRLPTYMAPVGIEWRASLPRNPNGKFDRPLLAAEMKTLYANRTP